MKKFLVMLCVVALLAIGASAAETVIYQNDFTDPMTIFDFQNFRADWEIRDGALWFTDSNIKSDAKADDNHSHLIYQADEPLENYIIEVDMLNPQSTTSVLVNVQQEKVTAKNSGFAGYCVAFSRTGEQMAIGAADTKGFWKDNLYTSRERTTLYFGMDLHLIVIVKDGKLGFNAIDKKTGYSVCTYTYTIGKNTTSDPIHMNGTFGFRAMQGHDDDHRNPGNLHFDNLKVTTANETTVEQIIAMNPAPKILAKRVDTTGMTLVYENNFDDDSALNDFKQFYGTWKVKDGQVYLVDVETALDALLLYNGDDFKNLTDYVIEADMLNTQTQGGLIIRSQIDEITGDKNGSDFRGYMGLIGRAGNVAAFAYGNRFGSWGDNFKVSSNGALSAGTNLRMQIAVKGAVATITLTNLDTGKYIWNHTQELSSYLWKKGTFGFRLMTKIDSSTGLDNVDTVSFDNLKVYTLPNAGKTEIKMTVNSKTAFVNGISKSLDAAPIIKNSRTLLPVRFLAENLGAEVTWNDATKTATLKTSDITIDVTINAKSMKVNGADVALDSPAIIESGRTYLPLRAIANALGVSNDDIYWDGATSTATFYK
ncbi:MAG: copper amine oxidase N-terminal domain-containing protein [Clostridia bacterium]|nr:copper amine oxidase N-terminal domain-containing protein [Clostridia bacterium]